MRLLSLVLLGLLPFCYGTCRHECMCHINKQCHVHAHEDAGHHHHCCPCDLDNCTLLHVLNSINDCKYPCSNYVIIISDLEQEVGGNIIINSGILPIKSITITGQNNASIKCNSPFLLEASNITLYLHGLTWRNCYYMHMYKSPIGISLINFNNINIVSNTFHEIAQLNIGSSNVSSVHVENCNFQHTSGGLVLEISIHPKSKTNITISNNIFVNNSAIVCHSGSIININLLLVTDDSIPSIGEGSHYDRAVTLSVHDNFFVNNIASTMLNVELHSWNSEKQSTNGFAPYKQNLLNFMYSNNTFESNRGSIMHLIHINITAFNISHTFKSMTIMDNHYESLDEPRAMVSIESFGDNCSATPHIEWNDVRVSKNTVYLGPGSMQCVVQVSNVTLNIKQSNFTHNTGTALCIRNTNMTSVGSKFESNHGKKGGALLIGEKSTISSIVDNMSLINNMATIGGAVYVDSDLVDLHQFCNATFTNNSATSGGNAIYIADPQEFNYDCAMLDSLVQDRLVEAPAVMVQLTGLSSVEVLLGSFIPVDVVLNISLISQLYCMANFSLDSEDFSLSSTSSIPLYNKMRRLPMYVMGSNQSLPLTVTPMYVMGSNQSLLTLNYQCGRVRGNISLHLVLCSEGSLQYSKADHVCICPSHASILCSDRLGVVCIPQGSWYGYDNGLVVITRCISPYCNTSKNMACPLTETPGSDKYVQIPHSLSDQCLAGYEGISCLACGSEYNSTFGAVRCVRGCKAWHLSFVLALAFGFQILLGSLLLMMLRMTYTNGVGPLYAVLFYFGALSGLPLASYPEYDTLRYIVAIVKTFLLLDLEMFGVLPLCFPQLSQLSSFGLRFVGPILASCVLLVLSCFVRQKSKCCTYFGHICNTVCLIVLLSYWSLTNTAILIIRGTTISGLAEPRVWLQPSTKYLHNEHIPLWITSAAVLLLVVPVIVLSFSVSCLSRSNRAPQITSTIAYYLHSNYKPRYTWFSGVYVAGFLIFVSSMPVLVIQQLVLVAMATLLCVIQPYNKNWLNKHDAFLMINLIFVLSLLYGQKEDDIGSIVLVYICVFSVLVYLLVTGCHFLLRKQGLCKSRCSCIKNHSTELNANGDEANGREVKLTNCTDATFDADNGVVLIDGATTGYREPLLNFISLSENEGSMKYGINYT